MREYQQYVKDGDYFYLVHELSSKIDMLKGFESYYNSKDAHNGEFVIKHDDKAYVINVKEIPVVKPNISVEHGSAYNYVRDTECNTDKSSTNKQYPSTFTDSYNSRSIDEMINALNGGSGYGT